MKPVKLGTIAIVALVALRLGAGWLFYREGTKKIDSGTFTSQHFLTDATGPFAGSFQRMVPDLYGHVRLNQEETLIIFQDYHDKAIRHFDLKKSREEDDPKKDKQQDEQAQATQAFKNAEVALKAFFAENAEDLEEYALEAERLRQDRESGRTRDVNFRVNWQAEKERELDQQLNGWLTQVDDIWQRYEEDINAIPSDEQYRASGYLYLEPPGSSGMFSSAFADKFLPWFTTIVGVLLILGLFTRVAAIGGAGFLSTVVLTQPPWLATAADTNYQIVLMLGLLVVAAVGAGRWGGLDFFVGLGCRACCGQRAEFVEPTAS